MWKPTQTEVDYVQNFGGLCRDCADENGVCPNSGLPCEQKEKAIRYVLNALSYGYQHGYLQPPPAVSVNEKLLKILKSWYEQEYGCGVGPTQSEIEAAIAAAKALASTDKGNTE